ncbi:hypothetical protein ACFCYH_11625 [Streptomyces sp. NPDC056400]|uniref:hypothetical protein n=1 Tax=Streptomyces sp. NPDC056400 TaxID=3345808 RepID=UPI0035DD990F
MAMDAVLDALRPDAPDLSDVDEKTGRFVTLARAVHRAAETVVLEGPASPVGDAERQRILYPAVKDFRLAARGAIGRTDWVTRAPDRARDRPPARVSGKGGDNAPFLRPELAIPGQGKGSVPRGG